MRRPLYITSSALSNHHCNTKNTDVVCGVSDVPIIKCKYMCIYIYCKYIVDLYHTRVSAYTSVHCNYT